MTIGRGDDATSGSTTARSRAGTRGSSSGPDGPMIEDAGSRFGVLVTGEPLTGPRRLEPPDRDPARQRRAAGRERGAASASGRRRASAEPTPIRTRRSSCRSGRRRMGLRAARRWRRPAAAAAALRLGAQARRRRSGRRALRAAGPAERGVHAHGRAEDARLLDLLDGGRTIGELLGEATTCSGRRGRDGSPADRRVRRSRHARRDRGDAATAPRAGRLLARVLEPRERTFDVGAATASCARTAVGPPVLLPAGGDLAGPPVAGRARARSPIWSARATGRRWSSRTVCCSAALVFIAGRFVLVALHELAHGLALAHYGRRTDRAGLRLVLIFPYAFVDTSEAYFEAAHAPDRDQRGRAADRLLAAARRSRSRARSRRRGTSATSCSSSRSRRTSARSSTLNPFLDRDGYQILSDWLRQPRLRQRARAQLARTAVGQRPTARSSPVLARYAIAGLVWSADRRRVRRSCCRCATTPSSTRSPRTAS